jgi:CPA2 family monovalent cation:H+ antiporter-2
MEQELEGHIIIAGYGRVGRYTADLLRRLEMAHVVIERDQSRLDALKAANIPVIYGDAGSAVVLEAAGLQHARLLLVTVSAAIDVELVVRQARTQNPQLHIVARATGLGQLEVLRGLGIHEVVQPEFEAGLEMVRQALLHVEVAAAEIERLSDEVRAEQYRPLETLDTSAATLRRLRQLRRGALDLAWYTLDPTSPLVGQSIGARDVRRQTGVSIVALLREDTIIHNPAPETQLCAADQIAVLGTAPQRAAFVELLTLLPDGGRSMASGPAGASSG